MSNVKKRVVKVPNYQVLVRLKQIAKDQEERSESGLILKLNSKKDLQLEQEGECEGYVMGIGPKVGYTKDAPFTGAGFEVGDCVQFYRHAGRLIPDVEEGYIYRMVSDLDIIAIFPEERIEL